MKTLSKDDFVIIVNISALVGSGFVLGMVVCLTILIYTGLIDAVLYNEIPLFVLVVGAVFVITGMLMVDNYIFEICYGKTKTMIKNLQTGEDTQNTG